MTKLLRLLALLLVVAPVIAQDEERPYFSLSTSRTFGSHDHPAVALSGYNVDAVQIRVYRVRDAVEFFRRVESAHSFGEQTPRPPGRQSFLEKVHTWKRGLRASIRRTLRQQFTESPSAHFRTRAPANARATAASAATYYAQAPLLNREQLVLSFMQPISGHVRWQSQQVPIGVKERGVYLVEATHGELRAYTILTVSDIVLLTKVGRERVLAFTADRSSGNPMTGVRVFSTERNGHPTEAKTDASGLVNLAFPPAGIESARIIAVSGNDVAFGEINNYNAGTRTESWTGYIYTERPVYRPGDRMYFRGILRLAQTTGYKIPSARNVTVQISDADGKAIYQKQLQTSRGGIVHDDFIVAPKAALGTYLIQVKAGESTMTGNFNVEEYKKPEYEVRVVAAKPRVLQGDGIDVAIDARYYFGEPVKDAAVKYAVYRSRYWASLPDGDDEPAPEEAESFADEGDNEQILEKTGKLDADGKLTVHVGTSVSDHKFDYRYRIEARVTDEAHREISGTGYLLATYGSFYVTGEPQRYVLDPSATAVVSVAARNYDGNPIATAAHLELTRWRPNDRSQAVIVTSADVQTNGQEPAGATLRTPEAGGSYRVRVTARTPEGREVESSAYIWVTSAGEGSFWGSGPRSLQIIPDKKSYQPGEIAHLLIAAGQSDVPLWISIEGRDIRSSKVVRSSGAATTFDYKVTSDDEPAFFVTAEYVHHGELFTGTKRVKVPPNEHQLSLKISTDKEQYLPGQTATYAIAASTDGGKPLPNADLSLGVVDEAIYAIRPDRTPDMLRFFYGQEWNNVYSESSLQFYFSGEAGTRRMQLAALRPRSTLAQLKPERLVQPKIRKAFQDTAFWAADLVTDADGYVRTKVTFPDSLTTWRATARASSAEERFGSAQLKTVVRKNLILRLALPRFLVQSDEVDVAAIVHNYLPRAKRVKVSITPKGVEFTGNGAAQEIEVASRSEATVTWRVKAQAVRQAVLTAQALSDEESDAVELPLPVHPPGVPVRQARAGYLADANSTRFSFSFPSDAVPASRSLSIGLSSSVAGSLFGALDYLSSYPYGCVEQTMSGFLPGLMVARAVSELGLKQPLDRVALDEKVQAGLAHLYEYQHDDGGWGWWQSDESHPFMTAYVVAGLADARRSGIAVNEASLAKSSSWLASKVTTNSQEEADLRAYAAYALSQANRASAAAVENVYRDRSQLSPYGQALLGLTFELAHDRRVGEITASLERNAKQNDTEAWWPATRDTMLDFEADTTPEATAFALKLLSHQRAGSPLLPKAALWLVDHRDEGAWWSTTKQTATVIYGLLDYLKASHELHPDIAATVLVNGRVAAERNFKEDTPIAAPEITLNEESLQPGTNQIEIRTRGTGRLYFSAAATHYSTHPHFEKQGAVSLNVLRDYFRLMPGKDGERIVYDLTPLTGPVTAGDTLAVRLTVTGSGWQYLMAEDPIAAGTEFIEKDGLYAIRNKPPWWQYWFTKREFHDDRMAIFQRRFPEGQQQFFYLLKVVNPGLFHVSAARVSPLYQPAIRATTEQGTLEVR